MVDFPRFTLIKSSFATKSIIERPAVGEDSLMEHSRQANIKALPDVAPRTSSLKSRTVRPPREPSFLTDLVLGTLIQYSGEFVPGSAETQISSFRRMSRRCSIGLSSRASGEAIFM